MSAVVARSPPTLTCEPAPKKTPLGLTSQTCPFAVSDPSICEAPGPVTRLSAMEPLFGCWKATLAPLDMEKLCQLKMALSVPWRMTIAFALGVLTLPLPATTDGPVGRTGDTA